MKLIHIITASFFVASGFCYSQRLSQKVGTNPTIIASSAVVEIESTTKGFLPPRMNFLQRNAIASPVTGLIVYCTDCGGNGELEIYNGFAWANITGNAAAPPAANVPTSTGGTLEFMAHNLGADMTADPLAPSWRLNGAYFQWGKKPIDTNNNLYKTKPHDGAAGFAAAPTSSGSTEADVLELAVPSWTTTPESSDILWNTNNGNLSLAPIKGTNDPCPTGWRIPTRLEWLSIYNFTPIETRTNWSSVGSPTWFFTNNGYTNGKKISNGATVVLYLPAAGGRNPTNGLLGSRNESGNYWSSSTHTATNAYALSFLQNGVTAQVSTSRVGAYSIRCVRQ